MTSVRMKAADGTVYLINPSDVVSLESQKYHFARDQSAKHLVEMEISSAHTITYTL